MRTAVRRVLLMSALLSPSALYALGLGEIRLNSALNQPFDAEIELVSAAQEDLAALRASLASTDTFQRYGLERPAYLADFTFRVVRSEGRDVLRVTSPKPVTEPFVTLLVEANWPRGRLLREYTVLLDPPIYAPAETTATTQVEAPKVSRAPEPAAAVPAPARTEPVAPAGAGAAEAPPAPRRAATIEPGSTYRVRPNDTLSQIASAAYPGTRREVNRAMLAVYQANPGAFGGNINVLRAGAELTMPSSGEVAAISASAAATEVARQYRVWSEGAAQAADASGDAGRLRLVTPDQGTAAPSTTTTAPAAAAASGSSDQLQQRVQQLESELAEARRLLEVRNAELATLQGAAAPVETGEPVPSVPGEGEPAAEAPTAEAPTAETPVAEAAPPAAEPEETPQPAPAAAPEEPAPSLLDTLLEYWWALVALLAAALGVAFFVRSRRQTGAAEDDLEEVLAAPAGDLRAPSPKFERAQQPDIVVEERKPTEPTVLRAAPAAAPKAPAPPQFEETISGEAPVGVEPSDPLAEADFHMAYGLYDQAAELVQMAAKREPQRRDLKLKLAEIYFVWGNRERFLEQARKMSAERVNAPPGEWDKVVIMGRQLAADDPLFAASAATASVDNLDIDLQPSDLTVDLEVPGAGEPTGVDLDVTLREPRVEAGEGRLDFTLDEPVRGVADAASLAPTIESPQFRATGSDDPTTEVPVEELGIDMDLGELDELEDMLARRESGSVEDTIESRTGGPADDLDTELLSSTSIMRGDELQEMARKQGLAGSTSELPTVEMSQFGGTSIIEQPDFSGLTSRLPAAEETQTGSTSLLKKLDFALDGEAATMSEVGTKLDLARAYIDMGDPEGARSILDEVLKEGSAAQKKEAERLMAGLP